MGAKRPTGVVDNLVEVFRTRYGMQRKAKAPPVSLVERMEAAMARLERRARA